MDDDELGIDQPFIVEPGMWVMTITTDKAGNVDMNTTGFTYWEARGILETILENFRENEPHVHIHNDGIITEEG